MSQLEAQEFTISILHRLSYLVMWLAFVLFHVALLSLFLLGVWLGNIGSADLISLLRKAALFVRIESIWPLLAFFGLSGSVLLWLYVRIWRKLYWAGAIPFLWDTIEKRKQSKRSPNHPASADRAAERGR